MALATPFQWGKLSSTPFKAFFSNIYLCCFGAIHGHFERRVWETNCKVYAISGPRLLWPIFLLKCKRCTTQRPWYSVQHYEQTKMYIVFDIWFLKSWYTHFQQKEKKRKGQWASQGWLQCKNQILTLESLKRCNENMISKYTLQLQMFVVDTAMSTWTSASSSRWCIVIVFFIIVNSNVTSIELP